MIPKTINYCWFGGKPLPKLAKQCIASWRKHCPDYEIKEWNESNFNLNGCNFVKEAYEAQKWAFVSDYARLKIIYEEGGIYLDTDVEVIKKLDAFLENKCYLGEETSGFVNTGLGFGAEKGSPIIKEMLDMYEDKHFKLADGSYDMTPCPRLNTTPLSKHGYAFSGKQIWKGENVTVYPPEYFCPINYETGKKSITANTYSIHLYNASWHTWIEQAIIAIERGECSKGSSEYKLRRTASLPLRIINKISQQGLKALLIRADNKGKGKH